MEETTIHFWLDYRKTQRKANYSFHQAVDIWYVAKVSALELSTTVWWGAGVARLALLGPKFSFGPLALFWPFSRIGWPLAKIISDHPRSCLRNHIFSLFWLIHCRFSPNSYILKVFDYKILLGSLEFLSYVKVSSSEYLLLAGAAVVEVVVRTVTLPNLLFSGGARVCWFCTDCFCISTYRRMVNLSQFTQQHCTVLYWVTSSIPHASRLNLSMHRSNMENANTWRKTRIHTWR